MRDPFMDQILKFLKAEASTLEQLAGATESVATIAALVVAGIWTFRLFVKNRLAKPRAETEHQVHVTDLGPLGYLIHVSLKVRNQSVVLMKIASGEMRFVPMLPLKRDLEESIKEHRDVVPPGETEIRWSDAQILEFDWRSEPREIEPQECDTFHFDFVAAKPLAVFQIYSHICNHAKRGQVIGWNTTSIHQV